MVVWYVLALVVVCVIGLLSWVSWSLDVESDYREWRRTLHGE